VFLGGLALLMHTQEERRAMVVIIVEQTVLHGGTLMEPVIVMEVAAIALQVILPLAIQQLQIVHLWHIMIPRVKAVNVIQAMS